MKIITIMDLDIEDIILLSVEEAEQIPQEYRKFYAWWWLRSPGLLQHRAAFVCYDGPVYSLGHNVDLDCDCVRPALIISNLKSFKLSIYSKVELNNGTKWLVVSDNMLLCNDESFGKHRFDSESNDYEKSEIKQYIHEKANELGIDPEICSSRYKRQKRWEEATPIPLDMFEAVNKRTKPTICDYTKNLIESKLNEALTKLKIRDLDIEDITLLSIEEAKQIPEEHRKFYGWWWLLSQGDSQYEAAVVYDHGRIDYVGRIVRFKFGLVRPALIVTNLKSFNLPLYSGVELDNGTKWLVISDNMLLCNDRSFKQYSFDEKSTDYKNSDIKQYIHDKAKELGIDLEKSARQTERQKRWEEAIPIPLDMFESVNRKKKRNMYTLDENLFESKLNEALTELKTSDLYIDDITLLSTKQAARIPKEYREFDRWWWLSTPHTNKYYVQVVDDDGIMPRIASIDYKSENCVRPALIVLNLNYFDLPLYSKVILDNGTEWLVISDNILLCDDTSFGESIFDTKSNDYEKSEIKQYIHNKAKELGFNFERDVRRAERQKHWEEAIPIPLDMFE